jgi:hypothetical protein
VKKAQTMIHRVLLLLALLGISFAVSAGPKMPELRHAVTFEMAKDNGLLHWRPAPPGGRGPSISVPQLKLFEADGRLVFQGSAREAIAWAEAGFPQRSLASTIKVTRWQDEVRLLRLPSRSGSDRQAVWYVSDPCPPCDALWSEVHAKVLSRWQPKLTPWGVKLGEAMPR